MAYINIDYTCKSEGEPIEYRSVNYDDLKFDTGNFYVDWYNCMKHFIDTKEVHFICSSSVDHFIMDHDSAKNRPTSIYLYSDKEGAPQITYRHDEKYMELFHEDGEKFETFEQFKQYIFNQALLQDALNIMAKEYE